MPIPRRRAACLFALVVVLSALVATTTAAQEGTPTCDGLAVTVDLNVGQVPTGGDDVILGTPGPDVIYGLGGDDVICGGDGDDIIFGGAGDDTIFGGAGDDTIQGNAGADTIDGGDGDDILAGNDGNDSLAGGAGNDTIYGGAGNDVIDGGDGADTILGGPGNDVILGGPGNDLLSGNQDDDTIDGQGGDDTIYGADGDDILSGGPGNDTILGGPGNDTILGGPGNDLLSGNDGDDILDGGTGDDQVYGAAGNDILTGGPGLDIILGGPGDDTIDAADGEADQVSGNAGADTCSIDSALDVMFLCTERPRNLGPFSIAMLVDNPWGLTSAEVALRSVLQGNGHTVTVFSSNATPIVNAVNNPGIDVVLFSPSFSFSMLYHPAQPDSLPMLDMTKNSWYRRYVVPWGDEIAGPRSSTIVDTSTAVFFEGNGVITWPGQVEGPVDVLTAPRWTGGPIMRSVMAHSTDGDAQHFLRVVSDTGAEGTLGVYVPPGSTVTEPAPSIAQEVPQVSVAPWLGLVLFNDDWRGDQYTLLNQAGEDLFEAVLIRLMNP